MTGNVGSHNQNMAKLEPESQRDFECETGKSKINIETYSIPTTPSNDSSITDPINIKSISS